MARPPPPQCAQGVRGSRHMARCAPPPPLKSSTGSGRESVHGLLPPPPKVAMTELVNAAVQHAKH